jgi:hypothetical protein
MSVPKISVRRLVAASAATIVVTGLLPVAAAQADPVQDCATVLAPAIAASDARPGYSARMTDVADTFSADLTSSWSAATVRSTLSGTVAISVDINGQKQTFTSTMDSFVARNGSWTSLPDRFASPHDIATALALLGKHTPAYLFAAKAVTSTAVHQQGVWPSHDVAGFLARPLPVTGTAPAADGGTVYTCAGTDVTETYTVNAAGLLSQVSVVGAASPGATNARGLVGTARRATAAARAKATALRARAATASGSETVTLDYTYAKPAIALPTWSQTVTALQLETAVEAIHLRHSVFGVAGMVATAADAGVGPRHHKVTTADIRRISHLVVRFVNDFQIIQIRVGYHPGGVWLAATNPFTGERVAYRVRVSDGRAKVSKIA